MYKALSPGAIGVQAPTIESAIAAARLGGFSGVEISPAQIADRIDRDAQQELRLVSPVGRIASPRAQCRIGDDKWATYLRIDCTPRGEPSDRAWSTRQPPRDRDGCPDLGLPCLAALRDQRLHQR